ncbi:hypothetical protein P7K49_000949, partial [Saguinus oedipus]
TGFGRRAALSQQPAHTGIYFSCRPCYLAETQLRSYWAAFVGSAASGIRRGVSLASPGPFAPRGRRHSHSCPLA